MDKKVKEQLQALQSGTLEAIEEMNQQVYGELQRLAHRYMSRERADHTLQATALVNEAYLRLADSPLACSDRSHFFSLAGRMMRRILVDHARSNNRVKRGAGAEKVTLLESQVGQANTPYDLMDLNEAIESLLAFDQRKAEILELQFFAGLNSQEIGEVFDVSARTIEREAKLARAWLHRELSPN